MFGSLTFRVHWTCLRIGCRPYERKEIRIRHGSSVGTKPAYHNQLGHVQLPACKSHASCRMGSELSKGWTATRDVGAHRGC